MLILWSAVNAPYKGFKGLLRHCGALIVLYFSLGRKLVGRWISRIKVSRTFSIDSHTVTVQLLRLREKL